MAIFLSRHALYVLLIGATVFTAGCGGGGGGDDQGSGNPGGIIAQTIFTRYAYVTNPESDTVTSYAVDDLTGRWQFVGRTSSGDRPFDIALSPNGDFAYVVDLNENTVSQFSVASNGALVPQSPAKLPTGATPAEIVVAPGGGFAYVANQGSDNVTSFSIAADGRLADTGFVTNTGADPTALVISPDGNYAYTADQGSDSISQYSIDATGALTPLSPASVPAGDGPVSIAIDSTGSFTYVANIGSDDVSQFAVETDGTLTPLAPATVAGGDQPRSVAIDPMGSYVYVGNLASDDVSQYSIGSDGTLTPLSPAVVPAGDGPTTVRVDPVGRYLYAANRFSSSVSGYSIGAGGQLTALEPDRVPSPNEATGLAIAGGSAPLQPVARGVHTGASNVPGVFSFSVGADGTLSPLITATVGNLRFGRFSTDPSGSIVYASESLDDEIAVWEVGVAGELTLRGGGAVALGDVQQIATDPSRSFAYTVSIPSPSSTNVEQYVVNNLAGLTRVASFTVSGIAPQIVVGPRGAYAYLVNRDSNAVSRYPIQSTGLLDTGSVTSATAGGSPQDMAIHPTGRFAYVVNINNLSVSQYAINNVGELSALTPATVAAGTRPSSVAITPDGEFVYVVNRGPGSAATISIYRVETDGTLTTAQADVAVGGRAGRGVIDPSGAYLYVSGISATAVWQFAISSNGALSPLNPASVTPAGSPSLQDLVVSGGLE